MVGKRSGNIYEMCNRIIKDTFMYDLFKAVAIERFAP